MQHLLGPLHDSHEDRHGNTEFAGSRGSMLDVAISATSRAVQCATGHVTDSRYAAPGVEIEHFAAKLRPLSQADPYRF